MTNEFKKTDKHGNKIPTLSEANKSFWDNFYEDNYQRYLEAIKEPKTTDNHRIGKQLKKDFKKKLKADKITATDFYITSIIKYIKK